MKVHINIIPPEAEEEVHFHIHGINESITQAMQLLTAPSMEVKHLLGKVDEKYYKIDIQDVFYIESIDRKVFAYTQNQALELSEKLYVLEEQLSASSFVRVTKSMLLNVDKIYSFYPRLSGNLEALLVNHEKVVISRRYVSDLKRKLGLRDRE